MDALKSTFLARPGTISLVGVGRSLHEWKSRLAAHGVRIRAIQAGRPRVELVRLLGPRTLLVFGALPARARWRKALLESGMRELRDFVFIA